MSFIFSVYNFHNASDLHLCSDSPPRWRRTGRLEPAPFPSPDLGALLKAWLNDEQQGIWWANGQVDFAATVAGGQRLRGSAFKQMRGVSVTLRLLPRTCPQLASLGAPRVIPELLTNASCSAAKFFAPKRIKLCTAANERKNAIAHGAN